jgi:cytochrome c-type biogenesis protein CcmE
VRGRGFYVVVFSLSSGVCGMKKRKDRSTEILIAFAVVALVAAILIVYFDTAHKLKLLDARIENIEMSGPQTVRR